MNRSTFCLLVALLAWTVVPSDAFGRGGLGGGGGRGGYGGGGGGRGGYGGGGGGYRGGGGGGYHGGEGGYHGGQGGYHGGEGGYHGGESGYHGGESGYHGGESGYHGGEGGYHPQQAGYRGGEGYHPNNYAGGYHPNSGSAPSRSQLNNFMGLPTDSGAGAAAGHNFSGQNFSGQNLQNAASTHPYSNTSAHSQGNAAQNWSQNHPQFSQDWSQNHPAAWQPTGAGAAAWGTAGLWAGANSLGLSNWLGMDSGLGDTYDYGNNVSYQGGDVYYGNQPVASSDQYYDQASSLASNSTPPPDNSQWMPLGVFAVMEGDSKTPSSTVQLAVNKQGNIRGNSADPQGGVLQVQGSVDKKTQRVAWTVGSNTQTVFDTGLYNLTKDQSPVLVHVAKDKTDQWLLVRLKQPNATSGDSTDSAPSDAASPTGTN